MKIKAIVTILSSVLATTLLAIDSPPVGNTAPDFSLSDAKGKTRALSEFKGKLDFVVNDMHKAPVKLSDYKGKIVVLEWFNPECPFVKKHYGSGNMQKLQQEYTGKGVVWLSVDSSAPGTEGNLSGEQAEKIMTAWKTHPTAFLLDPEGKAGRAYGAKNTPHMFIINPEGILQYAVVHEYEMSKHAQKGVNCLDCHQPVLKEQEAALKKTEKNRPDLLNF